MLKTEKEHAKKNFCSKCGRRTGYRCIHQNPFSVREIVFLVVLIMNLALIFYIKQLQSVNGNIMQVEYVKTGNSVLVFFIFLFLFFQLLLRKPYLALIFGCHQNSVRSFVILNKPFCLCSRCTGILLGVIISLCIVVNNDFNLWFLLFSVPLILDGLLQRLANYRSNNIRRFITGIMFSPTLILLFSISMWLYIYAIVTIGDLLYNKVF